MSEDIDLFVVALDGGETRRLSSTGDSNRSGLGPEVDRIRHAPEVGALADQPDVTGRTPMTRGRAGLFPIDWSADGSALLAGLLGNSGSEPIAVDPATGAARELGRFGRPWGADTIALSRDGRSVLVHAGSFAEAPPEKMSVLIVPFGGGKPRVAARGARAPTWNR